MPRLTSLLPTSHRLAAALAVAFAMLSASAGASLAQSVAAMVNGEPITSFDVEQRIRLTQISTQKTPSRKEALDDLVDEKLKIGLLKRFQIPDIDKDVDNAFNGMARRAGMNAKVFEEQLARGNVTAATLKSKIKADMVWSQIVRGRYSASFQFSERDVLSKLESKGEDAKLGGGYDYTLRPIVFVIPRGQENAMRETRRREAEALRARFDGCDQGVKLARTLREVAVRAPVVRTSADLPQQLREILEKTEIGKLSAPEITAQGVEVYALCGKKPSSAENAPGRREIREELASAQFKEKSAIYLRELRSQAMIEYR